MAETLNILRTYNCRTEAGVVKRGRVLDDWLRFGIYYGAPASLSIHDFSNWNVLVFDYDVLNQGLNPVDYGDTEIYLYLDFAGRYSTAARTGGYLPPEGNTSELLLLREEVHRQIDTIINAGFTGVFWDMCDTGYWDWSYCLESSTILKNQLQEYCDYLRVLGGKSFVNGTPWFAECGELLMLESFLSTWSGNVFASDWAQNDFFIKYTFGLEELGEAGGIPWTTGIYAWLYTRQYAPNVDIFAHSYGSPESIWQHDKQKFSLAGSLALGLESWNYIEPTNQTLIPLWAHSFYVGAPLECPQFDIGNRIVSRKYSGASVSFSERTETGVIDMGVEPDYWWNIDQDFEDINWEVDGSEISGANRTMGFVPDYIKIGNIYSYDDRKEVYFRLQVNGTFPESDIIPLYFYIGLDPEREGWNLGRTPDGIPYLHLKNVNAQVYLYGRSVFYWDFDESDWKYLYPARYKKVEDYLYYAVRKETLKFAIDTWDESTIRILPFFLYDGGSSYFVDDANAEYPGCLPEDTMNYEPEYRYVEWVTYIPSGYIDDDIEERPYIDCTIPVLYSNKELNYNQIKFAPTRTKFLYGTSVVTQWFPFKTKDIKIWLNWYSCVHNFTVYGYAICQLRMKDDVYSPHSAVIYTVAGQVNKRVSQVSITGTFDKAWIFDRENGRFVGPDNTPDTYFTSSPFSPTKVIDGQDIYIAIANDETDPTLDTWAVSGVSVTLVDWGSTHEPGYDIALPDLIEWQSVYDQWKGVALSEVVENTYLPAGVKRGGINLKKDSLKGTFTVAVPSSGAIVDALELYDITNAALLMRRTYEDLDHDDPDNTELLVWAYVDSWELTDTELRIRAKLNFHNWGSTFPKRRVSYFCPFVFKGPQCNYGGEAITCDKAKTTCISLGNEDAFGGIPTIPRLQRGKWG